MAGLAALVVIVSAGPASAHDVAGGALPAPSWLLGYLGAFTVLLAAVTLRAVWLDARGDAVTVAATPQVRSLRGLAAAGAVLGTTLYGLAVVVAFAGPDSVATNVVPVAVLVVWWVGLPVLCLLVGDVVSVINPFQLPVAAARREQRTSRGQGAVWTAPAFLFAFAWFLMAYHRPGSPRAVGVLLVVYAAGAIAGGLRWGRGWLVTGEAFGSLSAALAWISLRRSHHRRAVPAAEALMVVWIGATAFDAVAATTWWRDLVGDASAWTLTALRTIGLAWVTAMVAAAYLATKRLAERVSGETVGPWLGAALVPLATSWFLAHDLTLLLTEGQNFLVLASDPMGRGWDLLGTRDLDVDLTIAQSAWVGWVQVVVLLAGHLGAVVVAHDRALSNLSRRAAMTVSWAVAVLAAVSVVAAAMLVLE